MVFAPVELFYHTVGDEIYVHAVKNFRVPDYEDREYNFFQDGEGQNITSKHAKPVNIIIVSDPYRLIAKVTNVQSICLNSCLERTETDHIKISNRDDPYNTLFCK